MNSQSEGQTSDKPMDQLLREAVLSELDSPEGKTLRSAVAALHMEQARDLILRSVSAPALESMAMKAAARSSMASAVLAERLQLHTSPAPAHAQDSECLLDPPPDAPRDVIAATTATGAKVRWIAPNENGKAINGRYEVGITPKPTPIPPLKVTTTISGTEAQISGLSLGTAYTFTVVATNDDGKGPVSLASNPARIGTLPPSAATGVTAAALGGGQQITWTVPAVSVPPTSHRVRAYDSTKPGTVVAEQSVDGPTHQVVFGALAKGSYTFGVRSFGDGGFAEETVSAVVQHNPTPTVFTPSPYVRPGLPTPDALMLFDLGDAATAVLNPARLRQRMKSVTEKATQWRYDYLKNLAIGAAKETIGYDQVLTQLMQATVGKVVGAQAALAPVLNQLVKDATQTVGLVQNLTKDSTVNGILDKVASAASSALALEGLIHFLLDEQPLAFWTGLFDGLIGDICHFDTDLTRTNAFLVCYFEGAGSAVIHAIQGLITKVDQTVAEVMTPLTNSVGALQAELNVGINAILKELEETVVSATALVPGPDGKQIKQFLGNESGFSVVKGLAETIVAAVATLAADLKALVEKAIGNPNNLVISLIKDFIVFPILGIMLVSFAGGPVAGWILSGIIAALGIELIRQVARWLSGPLLGKLAEIEATVNDAVGELSAVLQKVTDLVPSPAAELQMVANNLSGLAHLLPQQFLKDVGSLVSDARTALLSQATELALTAERALGLENATAFDILKPGYSSNLTQAPDLPGGLDKSLFGGMAVLRDFHLLESARAKVFNAKETTVTLRLSLFKLLGGIGNPAAFTGAAADLFQTFLKGGSLLLNLDEQTLVEQGFPGLYRALVVDVKPIGLLSSVTSAVPVLPAGIPLTITHFGISRIRVRRDANSMAPPVSIPEVLSLDLDTVLGEIATLGFAFQIGPLLKDIVDAVVIAMVPDDFAPTKVLLADPVGVPVTTTLYDQAFTQLAQKTAARVMTAKLGEFLKPALSTTEVADAVARFIGKFPQFGRARINDDPPAFDTSDDAGKQALRDAIKADCLLQLGNSPEGDAGLPVHGAETLLEFLTKPLVAGRDREYPRYAASVAKWGGATLDRERDPLVEQRGFVTLVQDFGAETAAFNLLQDLSGGLTSALGTASVFASAGPARAYDSERQVNQYRAFENRGVEGQWLLNLESALNPGTLIDLLLEFTVRGCYDDGLAAVVKASRAQSASVFSRAQAVASSVNKTLRYPGSLPMWDTTGLSPVKTIRYSVRAHRENVLKSALAAVDALGNSLTPDGLKLTLDPTNFDRSTLPLKLTDPLTGIGPNSLKKFTLQFQGQNNSPLGVLHQLLPVSPADFGLGNAASTGTVEGFGFVVVPFGAKSDGALSKELLKGVTIHPTLLPLLPQFDPTNTMEYQLDDQKSVSAAAAAGLAEPYNADRPKLPPQQYLFMARNPISAPVNLGKLFSDTASFVLDFGEAMDKGYIYDVIFSISVRTPVPQLTVSPSVVAI